MADQTKTVVYRVDTTQMVSGLTKAARAEQELHKEAVKADKAMEKGADGATKATKKTTTQTKKAGNEAELAGKKAKIAGGAWKAAFGVAAVGAAAAAAAVGKVVKATVELAGELNLIAKNAANVGVTAEEFQILDETLGRVTNGMVDTVRTIDTLNKRTADAAAGVGPAAEAFDRLGISADEFSKLAPVDKLAELGDALNDITSDEERALLSSDLLGGAARNMGSAFKNGGEDIRAASGIVKDIGVASNNAAKQSEILIDAQDNLSQSMGKLRADVLEPLIPVLADAADEMRAVITEASKSGDLQAFGEALADIAESDVVPILVGTADAMAKLGPAIDFAAGATRFLFAGLNNLIAIAKVFKGDIDGAKESVAAFADAATFGKTNFSKPWSALRADVIAADEAMEEAEGTVGFFGDQLATTNEIVLQLRRNLKEQAFAARDAGETMKEAGEAAAEGAEGWLEAHDEMLEQGVEKWTAYFETLQKLTERAAEVRIAAEDAVIEAQERTIQAAREQAWDYVMGWNEASNAVTSLIGAAVDARIEAAENGTEREKRAALEAFHANKFFALSQAAVNTALAVTSAIANTPGGIIAQVAAGIAAGAAGAISIAAIAAEPAPTLHSGGMVETAHSGNMFPDETYVKALRQEAIVSPIGVEALGGAMGIAEINRGNMSMGGKTEVVMRWNNRILGVAVTDDINRRGQIYDAVRTVQPTVGRYAPAVR